MINIVLAEDHTIVRDGLRRLFDSQPTMQIVAEVDNVSALRATIERWQPHVLLLDYKMPGGDTFTAAESLRKQFPHTRILMLTGVQSSITLRKLAESALNGLLLKQGSTDELLNAIQIVYEGGHYLSPLVEPHLNESQVELTGRELQILNMIVLGLTRSQIAEQLEISAETVKSHRKNLMKKLQAKTVTELIIKAQDNQLLEH